MNFSGDALPSMGRVHKKSKPDSQVRIRLTHWFGNIAKDEEQQAFFGKRRNSLSVTLEG